MKSLKVKNRQRKALRNGKNNGRGNNQLTNQEMKACMTHHLKNYAAEILEAVKKCYEVEGRGYVNISLTNHPYNPYKTGKLYYVTEEDNKIHQLGMPFLTENDISISERISNYEPAREAVVCIWYDTNCFVTTLTDTYAEFESAFENRTLTIH